MPRNRTPSSGPFRHPAGWERPAPAEPAAEIRQEAAREWSPEAELRRLRHRLAVLDRRVGPRADAARSETIRQIGRLQYRTAQKEA